MPVQRMPPFEGRDQWPDERMQRDDGIPAKVVLDGHHAIAKTRSARRHCQGPKAARSAGGAERSALRGAEHRSSIECVMVSVPLVIQMAARMRAPNRAPIVIAAHTVSGSVHCARTGRLRDPDLPHQQDQIVRTKWPRSRARSTGARRRIVAAGGAIISTDADTDNHGVSDPSGHGRDHLQRAHR